MLTIATEAELGAAFGERLTLLYKHSPLCATSGVAYGEVIALHERYRDVPVFVLDVVASRSLARLVAERTGIVHESPQAIILLAGAPAWHASHHAVRTAAIARQLEQLRAAL